MATGKYVVRNRGNRAYIYHRRWSPVKGKMVERYCGKADGFATPRFDLRTCDFRDLEIEPGTVDLILTDPPYLVADLPLFSDLGAFAARVLRPGGFLVSEVGHYALPDAHAALGGHLRFAWQAVVIHQAATTRYHEYGVVIGYKPVLVYVKPNGDRHEKWPRRRYWKDVKSFRRREKAYHEWQKNLEEAQEFVRDFTDPGDLVVDPFLGSGTNAVAARGLGRGFIGCDVDENAVATARARVSAELGVPA